MFVCNLKQTSYMSVLYWQQTTIQSVSKRDALEGGLQGSTNEDIPMFGASHSI